MRDTALMRVTDAQLAATQCPDCASYTLGVLFPPHTTGLITIHDDTCPALARLLAIAMACDEPIGHIDPNEMI
jgi:hypothetical protein